MISLRNGYLPGTLFLIIAFFISGCFSKETSAFKTVSIQPHFNPHEMMIAGNTTRNLSDSVSADLGAMSWTIGGTPVYFRGLTKFDFPAFTPNTIIVSARLSLFSDPNPGMGDHTNANFGNDNEFYIQRVVSKWSDSTTWQRQPEVDTLTRVVIPHTSKPRVNLVDIDVTQMVQDMVRKGNYGFQIRLKNETLYNSRIFCSSRHEMMDRHPRLVITYR